MRWNDALYYSVALLVCIAIPRTASAQFDESRRLHRDVHRVWSVEDGLPSNSTTSFAQTPDGYLWVTTHEGLVRFDGVRFETYDRASTDLFESNHTEHAQTDARGRLWFTIKGQGVAVYDRRRFRVFGKKEGLVDSEIRDLLVSSDASVWVATDGGGLLELQNGRFVQKTIHEGLPSNRLSVLARDAQGRLWIGTTTEGLAVSSGTGFRTFTEEDGLPSDNVLSLLAAEDDNVYVGTDEGMARIAGEEVFMVSSDSAASYGAVTCMEQDAEGRLWLGTDGNGVVVRSETGVDRYTSEEGLSFDRVEDVFFDRSGGSWVATNGGGVNLFYRGRFTTFGAEDGLGSEVVLSIFEDEEGTMWFGTLGGGLNEVRGGEVTTYTKKDGLSQSNVLSAFVDSRG